MESTSPISPAPVCTPEAAPVPTWRLLVNLAAYQAGWAASVLAAAAGQPWLGAGIAAALAVAQLPLARAPLRELGLVLAVAALGAALDSAQAALGVFRFPGAGAAAWLCPPWLVALWALFATTFNVSLRPLQRRPLLAALLGAVGGPLAYWAGARLGAVTLLWPLPAALAGMALVWALAVPALLWLAGRFGSR